MSMTFRSRLPAAAVLLVLSILVIVATAGGLGAEAPAYVSAAPAAAPPVSNTGVLRVPFQLVRHKILVPVRINGSAVYDFVLDSGSPAMLLAAPELAPSMGLDLGERLRLHGAGKGEPPRGAVSRGATVAIEALEESVELTGQTVYVLTENPGFGAYLGVRSYGIVGRELFERYVVEIDFERRLLLLHDPEGYAYQGNGEVLDIRVIGGHPHCDGVVVLPDGRRRNLDLVIDSGAGSALTLIEDARVGVTAPDDAVSRRVGRGLNGEIQGAFTRLPQLELGAVVLTDVVTAFASRRSGIAPNAQANLGAEVLRRFRVIFDYRHRRLILEPTAALREPFEADMSGILLRAEGLELDQLIIEQVRDGSPASLIGIEAGDRLLSLDGRSVNLEQAVELLRQRDGYRVPLTLDRAGQQLEKQLTLKRDV